MRATRLNALVFSVGFFLPTFLLSIVSPTFACMPQGHVLWKLAVRLFLLWFRLSLLRCLLWRLPRTLLTSVRTRASSIKQAICKFVFDNIASQPSSLAPLASSVSSLESSSHSPHECENTALQFATHDIIGRPSSVAPILPSSVSSLGSFAPSMHERGNPLPARTFAMASLL